MKQKTIFMAISTQKGGVGKSTLTALAASYLDYVLGYNVAIIDCDYPQCSIHELRKREVQQITKNSFYKQKAVTLFQAIGKQPYPIICSKPEEAISTASEFLNKESKTYDVVFFDMPGTINNSGMLITFLSMDYVFTPMYPSRIVMESTLAFISNIKELLATRKNLNLKEIYLFWNRIDGRVKRDMMESYEKIIAQLELKTLKIIIPQLVRFDKEQSSDGNDAIFLSTIFPPDKTLLKGSNIELLRDEILMITGFKNDQ
jgi:chromosome partitioning protein